MRAFIPLAIVAAIVLPAPAALPAAAHEIGQEGITVVHPMARPIMAGRPGAAYMAIVNDRDEPLRLVGARSPAFASAELHESIEENGISKMRPVAVLEIAPGDTALLEPGGMHMMLMGGTQAFKAGDEFPLTLIFEDDEEVEVPVMVGDIAGGMEGMDGMKGMEGMAPAAKQ